MMFLPATTSTSSSSSSGASSSSRRQFQLVVYVAYLAACCICSLMLWRSNGGWMGSVSATTSSNNNATTTMMMASSSSSGNTFVVVGDDFSTKTEDDDLVEKEAVATAAATAATAVASAASPRSYLSYAVNAFFSINEDHDQEDKDDERLSTTLDDHRLLLQEQEQQQEQLLVESLTDTLLGYLEQVVAAGNMGQLEEAAAADEDGNGFVAANPLVAQQLKDYVSRIASLYHADNPFHNFEHASHVAKSLSQLLSSLKNCLADEDDTEDAITTKENSPAGHHHHDQQHHVRALLSDPLAQFALLFSALIHDVDHSGVPNAQLVSEGAPVARHYGNQSVAEQNSFDLAMALLSAPPPNYHNKAAAGGSIGEFAALRAAIYGHIDDDASSSLASTKQKERFERLVRLSVLATDIADPTLRKDRHRRWDLYFANTTTTDADTTTITTTSTVDDNDEKSQEEEEDPKFVILLEYLMHVSDVSATMQDWTTFNVWNERLVAELRQAFRAGRTASPMTREDPVPGWYQGEIGFFDFYVIPLAKRFLECCGCGNIDGDNDGIGFDVLALDIHDNGTSKDSSSTSSSVDREDHQHKSLLAQARWNRHEWLIKGEAVVADMKEQFEALDDEEEQKEKLLAEVGSTMEAAAAAAA